MWVLTWNDGKRDRRKEYRHLQVASAAYHALFSSNNPHVWSSARLTCPATDDEA